jgi:hypothetical protein
MSTTAIPAMADSDQNRAVAMPGALDDPLATAHERNLDLENPGSSHFDSTSAQRSVTVSPLDRLMLWRL